MRSPTFGRRRTTEPRPEGRFAGPLPPREITTEAVTARLSFRLRSLIGPGRPFSYREAAELTGITERTIRAYVDGSACPSVARYNRLLTVFGPQVGIELARMLGWEPRATHGHVVASVSIEGLRTALGQCLVEIDKALDGRRGERVLIGRVRR